MSDPADTGVVKVRCLRIVWRYRFLFFEITLGLI